MSDAILPALLLLVAILPVVGGAVPLLPRPSAAAICAGLCAAGMLICLPSLIGQVGSVAVDVPVGSPGLALVFTLDPLNAVFLQIVLLCGGVTLAKMASAGEQGADVAAAALTFAGLSVTLLAGSAVMLEIGLWSAGLGLWNWGRDRSLPLRVIIAGLLALVALCLLTPNGALDFGAIRATQAMPSRAAAFGVAAGIALLLPIAFRDGFPGSLGTGFLIPTGIYILIRLLIDLPGANVTAWSGYTLMLAGAGGGVAMGWRATGHPDLGGAVDALLRQYGAIAVLALGVCIVGKSSDLPETTCVGLAAAIMLALGGAGLAGTLASLGGSDLARGAGSWRLARLGGLIHTMPLASGVFAVSLLAFAPAPPGLAFAGIWLLLQALLSAPPTGGLIAQIPLIAATVAVAASAGLATATTVRLAGIAILGRPRSARASSALDITRPQAVILSALAGVVLVIGLLPGIMLRALAEPAIGMLSGTSLGARAGWTVLSAAPSMAGYASLPVFALLLLAAGGVVLVTRRYRSEQRLSTIWTGGLPPPTNLPFDVPMAQSAGTGFRPVLPHLPALSRPRLRLDPRPRLGLRAGIWVMLSGVSLLLLASSLAGSSGP